MPGLGLSVPGAASRLPARRRFDDGLALAGVLPGTPTDYQAPTHPGINGRRGYPQFTDPVDTAAGTRQAALHDAAHAAAHLHDRRRHAGLDAWRWPLGPPLRGFSGPSRRRRARGAGPPRGGSRGTSRAGRLRRRAGTRLPRRPPGRTRCRRDRPRGTSDDACPSVRASMWGAGSRPARGSASWRTACSIAVCPACTGGCAGALSTWTRSTSFNARYASSPVAASLSGCKPLPGAAAASDGPARRHYGDGRSTDGHGPDVDHGLRLAPHPHPLPPAPPPPPPPGVINLAHERRLRRTPDPPGRRPAHPVRCGHTNHHPPCPTHPKTGAPLRNGPSTPSASLTAAAKAARTSRPLMLPSACLT